MRPAGPTGVNRPGIRGGSGVAHTPGLMGYLLAFERPANMGQSDRFRCSASTVRYRHICANKVAAVWSFGLVVMGGHVSATTQARNRRSSRGQRRRDAWGIWGVAKHAAPDCL